MIQSVLVQRPQPLHRRIGVRGRLEIGHEMVAHIATFEPPDALVDLFTDGLPGQTAAGAEAAVVTKYAPPDCHAPIDIRAGESPVHAYFLHAMSKLAAQ